MSNLNVNNLTPLAGASSHIGVSGSLRVSGSITANGNITLGDSTGDSVSFGAEISSSLIPDAGATYALGTMAKSWGSAHIHGLAHIHTASINLVSSSLIPSADDTHNLGSLARQWKDLYVDGIGDIDIVSSSLANITTANISSSAIYTLKGVQDLRVPGSASFGGSAQLHITDGGIITEKNGVSGAKNVGVSASLHVSQSIIAADITLNKDIQSAAPTDASHYSINGKRVEVRSQLQSGVAADTGWTLELRNSSIAYNSLIIANVIGGEGAIISGSVVTANVVAANTASLNFFNTGVAIVDDAQFTASIAIL